MGCQKLDDENLQAFKYAHYTIADMMICNFYNKIKMGLGNHFERQVFPAKLKHTHMHTHICNLAEFSVKWKMQL